MKAIVQRKYGSPDVLHLEDVEQPKPDANDILIKVHAASINPADSYFMRGEPLLIRLMFGLIKPKHIIPGTNAAGIVKAVGANVTAFQVGDPVFGSLSKSGLGGLAQYVCAPEHAFVMKPANISFEQAASVPTAGLTALQALRNEGHIRSGQKVLINGASGGVGTFAIQLAKYFGAEVTAVCSTNNLDIVRAIGADHVIDYTLQDLTQISEQYDLFVDNVGHPTVYKQIHKRSLTTEGVSIIVAGSIFLELINGPWMSLTGRNRIGSFTANSSHQSDLLFMSELLKTAKVIPVIDRCYSLRDAPEAIRHLETGHARGKIVIKVS